jgi:hypothetical protein
MIGGSLAMTWFVLVSLSDIEVYLGWKRLRFDAEVMHTLT